VAPNNLRANATILFAVVAMSVSCNLLVGRVNCLA
jgi:hypothetical protein